MLNQSQHIHIPNVIKTMPPLKVLTVDSWLPLFICGNLFLTVLAKDS